MAEEIVVVKTEFSNGEGSFQVLFLYDLTGDAVKTALGTPVAATPSSGLPSETSIPGLTTQIQRDKMDAGEMLFQIQNFTKTRQFNNAEVLQQVKNNYNLSKVEFVASVRSKFQFTGTKIDA